MYIFYYIQDKIQSTATFCANFFFVFAFCLSLINVMMKYDIKIKGKRYKCDGGANLHWFKEVMPEVISLFSRL